MASKILIVDDSATVRSEVRVALSAAGLEVVEAVDGLDGLRMLGEHADIAACVSDVHMPNLDGLGMVEEARTRGYKVPFIMLTTEGGAVVVARAQACGAVGWIVKPFDPDYLVEAIESAVGN